MILLISFSCITVPAFYHPWVSGPASQSVVERSLAIACPHVRPTPSHRRVRDPKRSLAALPAGVPFWRKPLLCVLTYNSVLIVLTLHKGVTVRL